MRILILIFVCFSFTVKAQNPLTALEEVKGKIADSASRKSLDYITVSLKTGKAVPVKTILTKSGGSFVFSELKPEKYTLSIVSVGYRTKTIAIDLTDTLKKNKDLGTIYINTSANRLNEVTVTADKPIIRQEVDRISYDIQADPESKVKNALEMMRKVPLLSLDAEDNIQLQGNTNYKILINGKPSGMMERNPKDILRSMPASNIQKIEVITTPPAKYDGEGLAGIINIITSKKMDNGYNGSVNLNGRFPAGGPGTGGSFTARSGKFGISVNGGASLYNSPQTGSSNSRITFGTDPTNLIQAATSESDSRSGYFGTELSFEPDSLNLITGQFNINGNRSESTGDQSSVLNSPDTLLQRYGLVNSNENEGDGTDASLNYQLGFRSDKNRLLTFSYRYYEYVNHQFNNLTVSDPVNYTDPDYQQDNTGEASEHTFQVDYVHPVKKLTIEGGIKGIWRRNNSDYLYRSFNSSSGQFETDPSHTNTFNNTQNVFGAYNTYQYNLKDWGFKAGLRIEQTVIDADFVSSSSKVKQNYLNFIPSVSVNRKFKNMSSLNFGFTRRMQRPGIYQLNPFVDRSNPSFESSGNPGLRPATGDMLQLNYSKFKKGSLNVGTGFMFINDLIMPFSTFNPETNITSTTYGNTGKARLLTTNFSINYPITKKWNYRLSGNFNYGWVEGTVNGVLTQNEGLMSYVFTSMDYRLNNGWRLNADMNYQGRNISLQGRSNTFLGSSFSVNKDLVKDKLTFSAATSNPFAKYRNSIRETQGTNFRQESYSQSYLRSYTASLNYRFGKLKEGIKKNKHSIRNDDVSGGSGSL